MCNNCNNGCNDGCLGCLPNPIKGTCVFYQGANLSCLDATKGDTYDSILATLNTKLCELNPASGVSVVVDSCSDSISVSSSVIGEETTYTVCLNTDITDQIDTNTNSISDLQDCMTNAVADIISDTIIITTDSQVACGRTIRLEIPTSSGNPTYDGIIYSDSNKFGTSGGTGDKILKSFTADYTQYFLSEGDEIRIKTNGEIFGDGTDVDNVKLQLYDSNSSTLLYSETFGGFDKSNKQSWKADWSLTLIDESSNDFLVNLDFLANSKINGTAGNLNSLSQAVINKEVTISDLTGLTIRVIYEHNCTSGNTYNFARQLVVEVRKKI